MDPVARILNEIRSIHARALALGAAGMSDAFDRLEKMVSETLADFAKEAEAAALAARLSQAQRFEILRLEEQLAAMRSVRGALEAPRARAPDSDLDDAEFELDATCPGGAPPPVLASPSVERLRFAATDEDGATGLLNRGALAVRLAAELDRTRRAALPLSLLLVDLDHLQRADALHGVGSRERALRCMGVLIRSLLAAFGAIGYDAVAAGRVGPEKFLIILPRVHAEEAEELAASLLEKVGEISLPAASGPGLTLSASIGVAASLGTDTDEDALVEQAEDALYRAKLEGRNRVRLARPPVRVQTLIEQLVPTRVRSLAMAQSS